MRYSRIFILGAGCSAECGYPLGIGLGSQLQTFYRDLTPDCPRIKKAVEGTIAVMQGLPALETLDQLAKQINDDFLTWRTQSGGIIADQAHLHRERLADKQILDAKIAISAMFVAREEDARTKGLVGYHRLLESLFGGGPWQEALAQSDSHILSFNYDRLLEIAFRAHFNEFPWRQRSVYDASALNSGFNSGNFDNSGYDKVQLAEGRFCFLKLHGSADWWVRKREGNRSNPDDELRLYWPRNPNESSVDLREFEGFLLKWEPLIAFPHEKQRAVRGETEFLADRYLEKVETHAASILTDATELRIIGYSFAPIDSRHVVNNLLNKAEKAKIIVQSTKTGIPLIKSRLEAYPTLRGRIEYDPTHF